MLYNINSHLGNRVINVEARYFQRSIFNSSVKVHDSYREVAVQSRSKRSSIE